MLAIMEARLPFKLSSLWQSPSDRGAQEDLRLMQQVKKGDSEAFNALMRKYEKTVTNLVYRFTGDRENAADLAQEVFLRVYQAADRFEARSRFFTYLYKVTLNLCRNARDKTRRRQAYHHVEDRPDRPPLELPDPSGTAHDQVERGELARAIEAAIADLPEDQREVVILQRFQGLAYEEIAELTGLSVGAVKSRLHRAKLNLQKRLAHLVQEGRTP